MKYNAPTLPPSACPDSERPTVGVLLTSPPIKNSARPESKGIARKEETF